MDVDVRFDAACVEWLLGIVTAKQRTMELYSGLPSYPAYSEMVTASLASLQTAVHEQDVVDEPGL